MIIIPIYITEEEEKALNKVTADVILSLDRWFFLKFSICEAVAMSASFAYFDHIYMALMAGWFGGFILWIIADAVT